MRLLVLSHPAVTPINQDLYARVERKTGWEVTIVLPRRWRNEYGSRRPRRWPGFRGRLRPLPVALAGNIPLHFYLARVRSLVQEVDPDVIYLHHEAYALASYQLVRAAGRLPAAVIGFYSAQNLLKRYPWPISSLERTVYDRCAFALPATREVAGVLRAKGFDGDLEVLPLGVDTAAYRPAGSRSEREFRVGYVGRLSDEKGVDTLLEALALPQAAELSAVIAGDGPAAARLRRRAAALRVNGRIEWKGYVPHDRVADVYRSLDLLVVPSRTVPSWREQFGRVVLEALACGVPVATSDSGELPRLVSTTGGGWTFREGDAAELAGLLLRLREDPRSRAERARRGAEAVRRLFDLEAVADRFIAVVQRAASR